MLRQQADHRLAASIGLLQRLLPPLPRPDPGVRVQIQVDLIDQTRFLLDQPLLDRHRLAAVPAGMTQEHPRHASPPSAQASAAAQSGTITDCRAYASPRLPNRRNLSKLPDRWEAPPQRGAPTSTNAQPASVPQLVQMRTTPAASVMRRSLETLVCRLFRDSVQFCSGLVDLVVCVGRHGGGGHRLTLAGERFVGPRRRGHRAGGRSRC